MADPLVTCTLLTTPGRDEWCREAIDCFESQTYPRRELIVLDGPHPIGAKRNIAAAQARGEIICHWDDDDWSHPERIERQVERLMQAKSGDGAPVDLVGFDSMEFIDVATGQRWMYSFDAFQSGGKRFHYALGTSFCYWKESWKRAPFNPELQVGEDWAFQQRKWVASEPANGLMWARIHPKNTSDKRQYFHLPCWRRLDAA